MFVQLALAKPWENPKDNEKFQSFHVTLIGSLEPILNAQTDYKPTEENPNVIVQTWGNNLVYNEIVIGDKHYFMGVDFEYEQECVHTAIGAPFAYMYGLYFGSKSNHMIIEYKYDFSAVPEGIDGTLEMLMVDSNGIISIRSLRGTGDLQNVQIMATTPTLGSHDGIVIGWPE